MLQDILCSGVLLNKYIIYFTCTLYSQDRLIMSILSSFFVLFPRHILLYFEVQCPPRLPVVFLPL